jgi:drug/metabolite transporter (DMT)-like permease
MTRERYWLAAAFLLTLVVAFLGMSWNMLETRHSFPVGTKAMLIAAVATAAASRVGGRNPSVLNILVIGSAVPLGASLAMLVEMPKDPSAHNLWPIALGVLAVAALGASAIGTLAGNLAFFLFRSIPDGRSDT